MTALLIAAQLALSMVAGVEIVTALFLAYCYSFGVRRGLVVGTCFSLLRCLLFGFFPTVVILYLVYYNLFALVFGISGKLLKGTAEWKRLIALIILAAAMTAVFTLLDDLITPWFFKYGPRAKRVYFYNSLPVMLIQTCCSVVTVAVLFVPLRKAFSLVK